MPGIASLKTIVGGTLTFDADRLPALGGLAASFARVRASTFLAGLWKEDIQIELGCYVATEKSER